MEFVKIIAKRNGFAYNIVDHPRRYKQISQAGLTDFEMINKLAKQCGYSVRVQNAELYFQPMTKTYDENKSLAKTFVMRDRSHPLGSTLYSFSPVIGESLDQNGEYKAAVRVAGVDSITPGVGGLVPPKIQSPSFTSTGARNVKVSFDMFVFDANMDKVIVLLVITFET